MAVNPKKILVTGATGFIGCEVAKQLSQKGHRPRLMVRRPLRGFLLKSLDAELVQADLRQTKSLERILESIDTVIHLGARAALEPARRIRSSIVEDSICLMRAAIDAGVKTFVYPGTILVYGEQKTVIHQQTKTAPITDYGRAKLEAESTLLRMAEVANIRFTSVRLSHTYGVNSLLFDQIRKGLVIFPGKGDNVFSHLHVVDAARALIKAAETGKPGVSIIADDRACTWNDFFAITQHFFPRLRVIRVPTWSALAVTGLLDALYRFTSSWNRFSVGAVKSWNSNLAVEPNTFLNVVGLEPTYPSVDQGIPAALDDSISFYWRHSLVDKH
jgi:nucleoside-diphosphate-sugar epimerase